MSRTESDMLPVEARHLNLYRGGRRVLHDVTISFNEPEITVLLGVNGAGKSLLLRLLAGLVQPDSGEVLWAGHVPHRRRMNRLGIVFHHPIMLRRSALGNVQFSLRAAGMARSTITACARDALRLGGLDALEAAHARTLSGGEKQRLALVRALAVKPAILMLDEATSNIDPASILLIEQLVTQARNAGAAVIMVTHDLAQARRLADRVIFLHHGIVEADAPATSFFDTPPSPGARSFIEGRITL